MDFLDEVFIEYGFSKVDFVHEPNTRCAGALSMCFPTRLTIYRIEFFGDEVDSIRKFDAISQLSVNKMTGRWWCPTSATKASTNLSSRCSTLSRPTRAFGWPTPSARNANWKGHGARGERL